MKKILKCLSLLLTCSLVNINIVNAATCEEINDFWATKDKFETKTNMYLYYGGDMAYNYRLYTLTENGKNYVAYCRNAGISATSPNISDGNQQFICKDTVFDTTKDSGKVAAKAKLAYEKGIVSLIQDGYKTTGTTYEDYVAANIALRAYEMLWVQFDSNSYIKEKNLQTAFEYYANMFLENPTITNIINKIDGKLQSTSYTRKAKFSNAKTVSNWTKVLGTEDATLTASMKSKITNLTIEALNQALDYLENGAASIEYDKNLYNTKKKKGDVIEYKANHEYVLDIKKFDSSASSAKLSFSCENCDTYNIDYEVYINGDRVRNYTNINLLTIDTVKNGTGKVTLEIKFEGDSNSYHGEFINYDIDIKYFDDTISTETYVMQDKDCTWCQNFYVLYAENVEREKKIEGEFNFETKDTDGCTAYIENADCEDEDDNDIKINEGYKIDSGTCSNISKENNENVVDCIIGGEDPADNSYRATDLVSNSYCSIYCKEDYHFTLPGVKETNSGKYFSLQATVKGTKSCYTSKLKERATFLEQLEEQRKKVIDAWNEWNKWYEGLHSDTIDDVDLPHKSSNHSCYDSETITVDCSAAYEGNPCSYEKEVCHGYCDCDVEYPGYKRYWSYMNYEFDEESNKEVEVTKKASDRRDGGSAYCGCFAGTGEPGSVGNIVDAIEGDLEEAEGILKSEINKYAEMLNEYNSCYGTSTYKADISTLTQKSSVGWTMDYDYDPDITFWYEESYMNNVITNEFETIGNINKSELTETFYTGDNGKVPTGDISRNDNFESISQFVCYKSRVGYTCGTLEFNVGKAKYVKQEITVDGSYITPTQYYTVYPTGAIVIAPEGQENNIENSSELTNLLPVGLGTRQGVYNYVIQIDNLGEYYSKPGTFGRLWGSSESVAVTVLEEAEAGDNCSDTGAFTSGSIINNKLFADGAYVCAYKVNCPDCPVECDPECEWEDCPEGDCPVVCENCLYTNGSTNILPRPITPSDINPNDRELGVNWKYDEDSISTGLELKAYATTKEIEEAGETIYDINYEDNDSSEEFSMQVKLTAQTINFIRSYNDKYESKGGYANNTLKCYDHKGSDGTTYDNIYCYSTFLDELIEETGGPDSTGGSDNVKIVGGTRYFTDSDRKAKTALSGYWTTWSEATGKGWTVETQRILAITQKNYKEVKVATNGKIYQIGPAWK